jgi:hypothetical protein
MAMMNAEQRANELTLLTGYASQKEGKGVFRLISSFSTAYVKRQEGTKLL